MKKSDKVESLAEIKELIDSSSAMYLVDYKGVDVADINEIRGKFKKEGVRYKVFKNTLLKRALDEAGGYDQFGDLLVGMTGVAFVEENYVAPPKIIKKYYDDKGKFSLKGCYIESQFYGGDQLETLANMPSKEEIMGSIVGSLASPAQGLAGVLGAIQRDLVSIVDQISKQEEKAA